MSIAHSPCYRKEDTVWPWEVRAACYMRAALEGFHPTGAAFCSVRVPKFLAAARRGGGWADKLRDPGEIREKAGGIAMGVEDERPLSDDEFVISPAARQNLAAMRELLRALEGDLQKTMEDGSPLPGSAWSWTLRQAAALRVREMYARMEDILEGRAPDGAIARLASELLGDYVAAAGVWRAVDLVVDTFRPGPDLLSPD